MHGKWWVIILRVRVVHSNAVNMGELIRVIRVVHSIVTVCVEGVFIRVVRVVNTNGVSVGGIY